MICEDKETNDNCTHTHTHTHFCSCRCRDCVGNNLLAMILSASAFDSCMFEFSIPDFNETNIISLFLSSTLNVVKLYSVRYGSSVSSQYCSERGERVPLSLYISRTRREGTIVAVLYFHFMTLNSTQTPK